MKCIAESEIINFITRARLKMPIKKKGWFLGYSKTDLFKKKERHHQNYSV